jgi:hypothetical protein
LPPASRSLRLLAFTVPAALAISGVQPLLAALTRQVGMQWALELAAPTLFVAGLLMATGRLSDQGGDAQPPWYSAWALLPGSFLLAGAASMCIFGAFVELAQIQRVSWSLLAAGAVGWAAALLWVRRAAR